MYITLHYCIACTLYIALPCIPDIFAVVSIFCISNIDIDININSDKEVFKNLLQLAHYL